MVDIGNCGVGCVIKNASHRFCIYSAKTTSILLVFFVSFLIERWYYFIQICIALLVYFFTKYCRFSENMNCNDFRYFFTIVLRKFKINKIYHLKYLVCFCRFSKFCYIVLLFVTNWCEITAESWRSGNNSKFWCDGFTKRNFYF